MSYRKPMWLVEELKKEEENKHKRPEKSTFVYPVPIVPNSGKIRKRKTQLYRKISYNLP